MRNLRHFLAFLALLFATALAGASTTPPDLRAPPQAQPGLWATIVFGVSGFVYTASPDAACRLMHESYNPTAQYLGPVYFSENAMLCVWEHPAGTGIPGTVVLHFCPPEHTRFNFRCVPDRAMQPVCNSECDSPMLSGAPQINKGNPANLNTGLKVQAETDYASADGLLRVDRNYVSQGTRGWEVLLPGFLEMDGPFSNRMTYHSRGGGKDLFLITDLGDPSSWIWSVPEFAGRPEGASRRRLSMVTTPTVNRATFLGDTAISPTGPAEVRLDMANGEYILFRRADGIPLASGGRRLVPVEHGQPGGHTVFYDYNDTSFFPYRVRDSLNRQMLLTWADAPGSSRFQGFPSSKVLSQIQLPDSTRIEYSYDHAESIFNGPIPPWALQLGLDMRGVVGGQITVETDGRRDRLRSVTRRDGAGTLLWQRQYEYQYNDNPYAMTAVRDQTGALLAEYSYTSGGLVTSSRLAGNINAHQFQHFDVYANNVWTNEVVRRVTGPLGRVEDYLFFKQPGTPTSEAPALMWVQGQATPTTPADIQSFTYNSFFSSNHQMTKSVDQMGRETLYTPDIPTGRPTSITEAAGTPAARQTVLQWHPVWDLPTRIERDGQRVDIAYTANALVASQTVTDLTTHSAPYATSGQARTITYNWGANSRLLSVNGPRPVDGQGRDDTVTFAYDAAGNVTSMTNGLGHVTAFGAYDANGRPGTMTDPNNVVTQFTYDLLGRVTNVRVRHPTTASQDAVTALTYDVEGRVKTITAPASTVLTMNYDLAGLLKSVVASNNERIDYAHDAMGNVTSQTVRRANATAASTITATFDALGRTLTQTLGAGRTWSYAYDTVGNLTGSVSPRNQSTANSFDALDRLVSSALPDGGAPALEFDSRDGVTSNRDPGGVITGFVRNGFGEAIAETSPDRGTSIYYYNSAGDKTAAIDGRGQRIDYSYDILGRRLSAVPVGRPASEAVTYTWDTAVISGSFARGRLSRVVDGDTTVEYGFDHRGNVTTKRQRIGTGAWATLAFTYDLADRRTQITYPSGRMVNYTFNTLGRVTQVRTRASSAVTTWTTLASGMTYESFGPLLQANYGNGLRMIQSWGNDGRLANRRLERTSTAARLSSLTYSYDTTDNIAAITDTLVASASRSFAYDPMDRMTTVTGTLGSFAREDFIHDANGNRLRVERRTNASAVNASETDTYTLASGTNRLTAISSLSGSRSFTHDARGNLTGESWANGTNVSVTYDGRGRLTAYTSGTASQTMLYNGADERIRVVTTPASGAADTRIYVYDLDHRVVGEYGPGGNGDVRAEYIWTLPEVGASGPTGGDDGLGGYMPLAVSVGSSGTLNWVHGNHMGVPLLTTNASGTAVTPTGYVLSGFPGQFANAVLLPGAGHYYNRYRDYDPTTGRYIQADPIGLAGDENPYAYALGNPLRYTDPSGEAAWLVPVAAGFAIAAGVDLATQALGNWGNGKSVLDPSNYDPVRAGISGSVGGLTGGAGAWLAGSGRAAWSAGVGWLSGGAFATAPKATMCVVDDVAEIGLKAQKGSLGSNPFKGKTPDEIVAMFTAKGFVPRGKNPSIGQGTYVNPKTGRSFHIDAAHGPPKGPHVGVHRPRGSRDQFAPRDYPL